MHKLWRNIRDFPDYMVSNDGEIMNVQTGRILRQSQNQSGTATVGMMYEDPRTAKKEQHHRSVALIVASEWNVEKLMPSCDTPINLNGDRMDNRVENLMFRPRWFAVKYNRQFSHPFPYPIVTPVMDIDSGEISENSMEAAMRYGLLEEDVVLSIANRTVTWPTYQKFEMIPE